jgi:hypothetical protein
MAITDPMNALVGLQSALNVGSVQLRPCELHSDLTVLLDHPNGVPRFTYASVKNNKVHAIALFVVTEPVEGVPCFNIGYAVIEPMRNKGVATKILEQAISELTHGHSRSSAKEFYLEAIVSTSNLASNKLAAKLISDSPGTGTDEYSGEPIFSYLRKVSCGV